MENVDKPVNGPNGFHYGYSWCGGRCRWGTTDKLKALDRYAEAQGAVVYVGIAADETSRLVKERKPYKCHPLAEWGVTEAEALRGCYDYGYFWIESTSGMSLYEILGATERPASPHRAPHKRPGKSVFDLEARFIKEAMPDDI